jgi:hypothetical protein
VQNADLAPTPLRKNLQILRVCNVRLSKSSLIAGDMLTIGSRRCLIGEEGVAGMSSCSPRWIAVLLGLSVGVGLAYGGPVYALDSSANDSSIVTGPAPIRSAVADAAAQIRSPSVSLTWPQYVEDKSGTAPAADYRSRHRHITVASEMKSAQVIPLPSPLAASAVLIATLLLLKVISFLRGRRFAI